MITPIDNSHDHSGPSEIIHSEDGAAHMPQPAAAQSPLVMLDDRLRGRWRIAVALGVVLGAIFAMVGYRLAPVRFASTGRIHVAPTGSAIMYETAETGSLPGYSAVVGTQALLVRSPRVIDQALRDPTVANLPLAQHPNARERMIGGLSAAPERGTELITVTFEAGSAEEAQAVVNAVLRSYYEIHGERTGDVFRSRLEQLRSRRTELQSERNMQRGDIREFVDKSEYGASDLGPILDFKLLRVEEVKQELSRIDLAMAAFGMGVDDADPSDERTLSEPSLEALERIDPDLAALHRLYLDLRVELEHLNEKYHGNTSHSPLLEAVRTIDLLQERIASRTEAARARWYASGGVAQFVGSDLSGANVEDLVERRTRVVEMLNQTKEEVRRLVDEQSRLVELQQKLDDTVEKLQEVEEMLDILRLESDPSRFSGRIEIAEWGSKLALPSKDRRRQLAVVGLVGGIGLSFALFLLLGSLDQRTYSASQLRRANRSYGCIGVLPDLATGRLDAEQAEVAVQCVHQIRNRIEAKRPPASSFILLVTSPFQGDGKTSLAIALGSSYACAGHRTLLVDCDLAGRGLSRQLGVSDRPGLKEVLGKRQAPDQASTLSAPNLDVLGAGVDSDFGPESVRRDHFKSLCEELRRQYDVIILDTGPFVGSIELLPVAAASDSVVLSVRRGRSRARLEHCIASFESLGIPVLGVVLNRASQSDCDEYVSYSAVSSKRLIASGESAAGGSSDGAVEKSENALLHAMNMSHDGGNGKPEPFENSP